MSKSSFLHDFFLGLLHIYMFSLVCVYINPALAVCSSCKSGVACKEGHCSEGSCDSNSRWYLTDPVGIVTDGPGNYSANMKCTWLIDSRNHDNTSSRAKIRLRLDNFATECAWDHLYIWDGDSTNDPLLASLSGTIQDSSNVFEITASSGMAYVHFYSDAAYTMPGFNISYEVSGYFPPSASFMEKQLENSKLRALRGMQDGSTFGSCCTQLIGQTVVSKSVKEPSALENEIHLKTEENDICELDCSAKASHGTCAIRAENSANRTCICDSAWTGSACDLPIGCPHTYQCQNSGNCTGGVCTCLHGFKGPDCSLDPSGGSWDITKIEHFHSLPPPSASHATVLVNQDVYWIGGETFKAEKDMKYLYRLDMGSMEFQRLTSKTVPTPVNRFGHTVVWYNDSLYMYGGIANGTTVVNELWHWQPRYESWVEILKLFTKECKHGCFRIATAGHTAHVINHKMLVFFGYGGPEHGFLNIVQEFNFNTKKWRIVPLTGAIFYGTYGHFSVYDPKSGLVFMYGGYTQTLLRQYSLTAQMLSYDPVKSQFKVLKAAPAPRFLHSGVLFDRTILVFGGNPHDESSSGRSAPCYAGDFYAYDIECDSWQLMTQPVIPYSRVRLPRFGHSGLIFKDQIYFFGGFQGILLNDVLRYTPGRCQFLDRREKCLFTGRLGRKCAWSERTKQCIEADKMLPGFEYVKCANADSRSPEEDDVLCSAFKSCHNCLSNSVKCQWCKEGNKCSSLPCKSDAGAVAELGFCPKESNYTCESFVNCMACIALSNDTCMWSRSEGHGGTCLAKSPGPPLNIPEATAAMCDLSCSVRTTCDTCNTASGSCMWCANEEKCIDSSAYLAIFPYGQCRDWQSMNRRCGKLSKCHDFKSCEQCMENPDCGWCDDGSSTGLGQCLMGSSRGPQDQDICPIQRWFFVDCPSCSCNGHSHCINGTSVCQSCEDFTEGYHCDRCVVDRFGDPRNGGNCTQCQCPSNTHGCDPETGNCKCSTKGTTGRQCEKCDEANHYVGHNGVCFYELPVGYQFTFNLTKGEDTFFTGINFKSSPPEREFDVKFTLLCTNDSFVNVSFRTAIMHHEEFIITEAPCNLEHKIDKVFSHDQLPFGQDGLNTTVYVYVHDFVTPSVIVISFAQHASLDLLHFFVVFACCFLSLLLLAAILWKVKQKYDVYRRRQRMFMEMEQMAKRPFACIHLEVSRNHDNNFEKNTVAAPVRKKHAKPLPRPCFVATEPLADGKHAVMSALICLPTGGASFTPPGQTGLIVGSTLVLYGSQGRKPSVDSRKEKLKSQKNTQETET